MIITHVGRFGDFVPSLIIPNYYYKYEKVKTTFVLSQWFRNKVGLEEFLMLQDFTEKVVFDPFVPDHFELGGQPYKFKPQSINDQEYYNLGMNYFPDKYLGELYAEEYDLKWDKDLNLKFLDENFPEEYRNLNVYSHFHDVRWDRDRYELLFTKSLPMSGAIPMDITKSLIHNLNVVYYSQTNLFYPNGFSVLLNACGIKYNLYNLSAIPKVYYL